MQKTSTCKTISHEAIPRALQKAERYRLLNQSWATESICLDVLEVDAAHQQALVMLLLALTDQFGPEPRGLAKRAMGVLDRISEPYQRHYYEGIVHERLAHAQLATNAMHAERMAQDSLQKAMRCFEQAESLRQPGNDDSILRWNTCARSLEQVRGGDDGDDGYEPQFGE
jgi:hypothetical protein